jgi:amino acid adenylation domain-containing protein
MNSPAEPPRIPPRLAAPMSLDANGPQDVAFCPFDESRVERPIVETFADVAARHPDNIACEDIDSRFTYAQVWSAARRLAATIDAAVPPRSPVGVLLPNQASYAIAVLACLGAARPCVLIDRNHPQDRVGRIVHDAGLSAVVLRQAEIDEGYLLPAGVRALGLESSLEEGPAPPAMPAAPPAAGAASFIVYTSGSTGAPKGIVLSQRGVLHRAAELVNAVHLRPDDKVLSLASPGTIGGLQQIFEVMLSGACLVKLDLQRLGLGQILEAVARRRITMMFSTPSVWRSVARLEDAQAGLASLRCIQSSGDTLLRVDYALIRSVLPDGCHVLSVYGATEAPALLQWFVAGPPEDEARVPAGYPLPGFDFVLLDEGGRPVGDGEEGELVIKSRFTSLGIWRGGQVLPEPFEFDPASPDARIYRTGDVVRRRADGLYVVLGRRDRQLKIRGNRVELAEIETALRRMPAVLGAAVLARAGQPEPLLLGFVVPRQPAGSSFLDDVRRRLAETLPAYMRPRALVAMDRLLLLPGRKIDEEALLAHYAALQPGRETAAEAGRLSLAMVDLAMVDHTLVDTVWRNVLGRSPRGRVSFEAAGGDSLQLLQLVFELERLSRRPLAMDRFHGLLTAEEMASELERQLEGPAAALAADAPAIFLFPPGGGGDAYLTAFRAACASRLPVRQVAYPGLRALLAPGASFEGIAADAAAQIVAFKPKGPLTLVGYSDGGEVAFEAARRLRALGRDVRSLVILDTDASGLDYPQPPAEPRPTAERLRRFVRRPLVQHLRRLVECIFPARLFKSRVGRRMLRAVLAVPAPLPSTFAFLASLHLFQVVFDALHRDWSRSAMPGPLDVPVVLFRSEEVRPGAPDDLGWRGRTIDLAIVPVPGNHSTMLAADDGQRIAEQVARRAGASG